MTQSDLANIALAVLQAVRPLLAPARITVAAPVVAIERTSKGDMTLTVTLRAKETE